MTTKEQILKVCEYASGVHRLFEHMEFAITDFIYVREFRTEINIEVIENNKQ